MCVLPPVVSVKERGAAPVPLDLGSIGDGSWEARRGVVIAVSAAACRASSRRKRRSADDGTGDAQQGSGYRGRE